MRIEVGYGLEGTMTDLMAGRIIRDVITPKFKNGDYNCGITDGAQAVIKVLEGDQQLESATIGTTGDKSMVSKKSNSIDSQVEDISIIERILLGCFIFGIIGLFTIIGIISPGVGWFLYLFLIPFWAMFPIIVLGTKGAFICLITYLIVFPTTKLFIKRTKWYEKAKEDRRVHVVVWRVRQILVVRELQLLGRRWVFRRRRIIRELVDFFCHVICILYVFEHGKSHEFSSSDYFLKNNKQSV
jgi:uncharacterized protein